jgi:splicing factor 3A subunit 1
MKLTAQFVARNGSKFLNGLRQRESRNPQFDFLQPEHPFFAYFQLLVEAYVHILSPSTALLQDLKPVRVCLGLSQFVSIG